MLYWVELQKPKPHSDLFFFLVVISYAMPDDPYCLQTRVMV